MELIQIDSGASWDILKLSNSRIYLKILKKVFKKYVQILKNVV